MRTIAQLLLFLVIFVDYDPKLSLRSNGVTAYGNSCDNDLDNGVEIKNLKNLNSIYKANTRINRYNEEEYIILEADAYSTTYEGIETKNPEKKVEIKVKNPGVHVLHSDSDTPWSQLSAKDRAERTIVYNLAREADIFKKLNENNVKEVPVLYHHGSFNIDNNNNEAEVNVFQFIPDSLNTITVRTSFEVAYITDQLILAIKEVHNNGVIIGNLSRNSIKFKRHRLYLINFVFAKRIGEWMPGDNFGGDDLLVSSPLVYKGDEKVTAASDLISAILIYHTWLKNVIWEGKDARTAYKLKMEFLWLNMYTPVNEPIYSPDKAEYEPSIEVRKCLKSIMTAIHFNKSLPYDECREAIRNGMTTEELERYLQW